MGMWGCGDVGVGCGGAWKSSVGTNQILLFMRLKGKLVVATLMASGCLGHCSVGKLKCSLDMKASELE